MSGSNVSFQFLFSGAERFRSFLKFSVSYYALYQRESREHFSSRKNLFNRNAIMKKEKGLLKSRKCKHLLYFLLAAGTHRQSRTQTGTGRITCWVSLSSIFHEEKGTRRAVTQRRSLRRKGALALTSGEKKVRKVSDHLREERLAIHVHSRHVEPSYVQYGWSQVDV